MPVSACNGREWLLNMSLLFPQHSRLDMNPSYSPLNHLFSRLGNPSIVIYRRWPLTADWPLHPHPTTGAFAIISALGSSGGTKAMIYQTTSLITILTELPTIGMHTHWSKQQCSAALGSAEVTSRFLVTLCNASKEVIVSTEKSIKSICEYYFK